MKNPTEKQIGGTHYINCAMQPLELITTVRCSFIQGSIIKYATRYRNKNKGKDLLKVIHYAQLAMYYNDRRFCKKEVLSQAVNRYVTKNKLSLIQRKIILAALYNNYDRVEEYTRVLMDMEGYANANDYL